MEFEWDDAKDLLPEHAFDYGKAKPNRFASSGSRRRVAIILDDDVAEVFDTTESVNKVLRTIIEVVPRAAARKEP